jgi:serine/threonine protein kinase
MDYHVSAQMDLEGMLVDDSTEPKALPFSLLDEITGSFSQYNEIGRGGFAVVYRVRMSSTGSHRSERSYFFLFFGIAYIYILYIYIYTHTHTYIYLVQGILGTGMVAVKKLSNAYIQETEFQREVECLMSVRHKNIVRFLGYCADTQGNMLMYENKYVMADVQQRLLCFEYVPKGNLHDYITGR